MQDNSNMSRDAMDENMRNSFPWTVRIIRKGHTIKVLVVCNNWEFLACGDNKRIYTV